MRTISERDLNSFRVIHIYVYEDRRDETEFYIKLADKKYGDIISINATITADYDYIIRSYSKNTLMPGIKERLIKLGQSLLDDLIYPLSSEHEYLLGKLRI